MGKRLREMWRGIRFYYWIALAILLTGIFVGAFLPHIIEEVVLAMIAEVEKIAENITKNDNVFTTIRIIFQNNVMAAIMMLGMGVFFGFFPIIGLYSNGAVLGYLLTNPPKNSTLSSWEILGYGILPHGIFEFAAVLLASGMGIKLGVLVFRSIGALFVAERRAKVKKDWEGTFRIMFTTVLATVVLLLVAAIIESTVTPYLLQAMK
ncbi:stage II sporulation protein M [Brevibacillus daliensis]|uniref:stage II sporulation protein M n=1 Tax=Brevibacillus daliensis TaxID=2892995 RepID=UPI001E5F3ED6|nr:stage II sporulation protein M [Brevibacillus daliensis]